MVDVLWVIDNSCSMADEQEQLTSNFPSFINYFLDSGVDYHIGVISTDLDDSSEAGQLRAPDGVRFIIPDTEEPETVFEGMATVGIEGSGSEKGRGAAYTAIELRRDDAANSDSTGPTPACTPSSSRMRTTILPTS